MHRGADRTGAASLSALVEVRLIHRRRLRVLIEFKRCRALIEFKRCRALIAFRRLRFGLHGVLRELFQVPNDAVALLDRNGVASTATPGCGLGERSPVIPESRSSAPYRRRRRLRPA